MERQPSIIFFDEIERLTKQRDSSDTFAVENIKGVILVQMSKIQASRSLVTVIGASNRPYSIDEAFVRRFPLKLHVPPPDTPMKMRLLQTVLDESIHRLSQHDIARLANDPVLEGASAAHITDVIRMMGRTLSGLFRKAEYFDKVSGFALFRRDFANHCIRERNATVSMSSSHTCTSQLYPYRKVLSDVLGKISPSRNAA